MSEFLNNNFESGNHNNGENNVAKYQNDILAYLGGKKEREKTYIVQTTTQSLATLKEEVSSQKNQSEGEKKSIESKEEFDKYDDVSLYKSSVDVIINTENTLSMLNASSSVEDIDLYIMHEEIPKLEQEMQDIVNQYGSESKEASLIYYDIGRHYGALKNGGEEKAKHYLQLAMDIQEKELSNTMVLANTYRDFAMVYLHYAPEVYVKYMKKAVSIFEQKKETLFVRGDDLNRLSDTQRELVFSLSNETALLADQLVELGRFDEALVYIEKIGHHLARAEIYRQQYNFDAALRIYNMLSEKYQDPSSRVRNFVKSMRDITLADQALLNQDSVDKKTLKKYLKNAIKAFDTLGKYEQNNQNKQGYKNILNVLERRIIATIKQRGEEYKEMHDDIDKINKRVTVLENAFQQFVTQELPQLKGEIKNRLSEERIAHLEGQVQNMMGTILDMKDAVNQGKKIDEIQLQKLENIFSHPNTRDYYITTQSLLNALYTGNQAVTTGLVQQNIPKTIESTVSLASYLPWIGRAIRSAKQIGIDGSNADSILAIGKTVNAKQLSQNIESQTLMNTISETISRKLVELRKTQIYGFSREKQSLWEHIKKEFDGYAKVVNMKGTTQDALVNYLSGISDTQSERESLQDTATIIEFLSMKPENDTGEENILKNIFSDRGLSQYLGESGVTRETYLSHQTLLYVCGKNLERYFSQQDVASIQKHQNNDVILQKFIENKISITTENENIRAIYLLQFKKGLAKNAAIN